MRSRDTGWRPRRCDFSMTRWRRPRSAPPSRICGPGWASRVWAGGPRAQCSMRRARHESRAGAMKVPRRLELAVGPSLYAVWHGRILLLPYLYGWRPARVLVSRSRDGELVARFVERFGLEVVRG